MGVGGDREEERGWTKFEKGRVGNVGGGGLQKMGARGEGGVRTHLPTMNLSLIFGGNILK